MSLKEKIENYLPYNIEEQKDLLEKMRLDILLRLVG